MEGKFLIQFRNMILTRSEKNSTRSNASSSTSIGNTAITGRRHPRLQFVEASNRTIRRRSEELRRKYCQEELIRAVVKIPNKLAKEVIEVKNDTKKLVNGALAMFVDTGMTERKYEALRKHNYQLFGNKYYPPYKQLQIAKEQCYPNDIFVTEKIASVKMQSLLDHTVCRIFESLTDQELEIFDKEFVAYAKWSLDGASNQ